jgi:periplasmic protein TonB
MAISLLMLARRQVDAPQSAYAASRYGAQPSSSQRWLSAGLSMGIAGGIGAALIVALVAPEIERRINPDPIDIYDVRTPPPEPVPPPPVADPVPNPPIDFTRPTPQIPVPPLGEGPAARPDDGFTPPPTPFPPGGGEITGSGGTAPIEIVPLREPVFAPATRHPRYADGFQPPYPPSAEREGLAGSSRVRVRIGPDGRVLSVEDLGSTDPRFFTATQRHALSRWRFRPATRDGVAVETTQELTVRFVLPTDR